MCLLRNSYLEPGLAARSLGQDEPSPAQKGYARYLKSDLELHSTLAGLRCTSSKQSRRGLFPDSRLVYRPCRLHHHPLNQSSLVHLLNGVQSNDPREENTAIIRYRYSLTPLLGYYLRLE